MAIKWYRELETNKGIITCVEPKFLWSNNLGAMNLNTFSNTYIVPPLDATDLYSNYLISHKVVGLNEICATLKNGLDLYCRFEFAGYYQYSLSLASTKSGSYVAYAYTTNRYSTGESVFYLSAGYDAETKKSYMCVSNYNGTQCYTGNFITRDCDFDPFIDSVPIKYNYKPVDYIFGNATSIKLSMIKEEATNGGKSVDFDAPTGIQRVTDRTDLYTLLYNMQLDAVKIIGYTDNDNYVALRKKSIDENTQSGVMEYYINGAHREDLDYQFFQRYGSTSDEFKHHYYLSYLVDVEKRACRQSIIAINPYTNKGFYNKEENGRNIITESYQALMFEWLSSGWFTVSGEDPNEHGGTSNSGGGSGDYNNIGDIIPVPPEPLVSAVDADFVTVYNPTVEQIKSLAKYMWGEGFNLESFKKIFADPMDCIIGLHIIPCPILNNGIKRVKVGNILSPISMNIAGEQFVDVDCGSIKINEYWGSYLDYSPYTKIIIYLPYIGTRSLEVDDVMNKTVHVKYRIDIITGSCVCFIVVNDIVMYQFNGFCLATIPITSQDYKSTLSSIMSLGIARAGVAASVASGGALAPIAGIAAATASANAVMNKKPIIEHGGSASGTVGFMSIQTPYITITRARQCLPKSQNTFTGYPSYTTKKLSTLTGFTQIEEIQLSSLSCTDSEREEIEILLKGGVII